MPTRPTQLPADLTDHWPEDPLNEDLARLASELVSSRRELSALSLDRIQVRVRQEIIRVGRRRRLMSIAAVFVLAIAAIIGARVFFATRTDSRIEPRAPDANGAAPIQDQFQVTLPSATPRAPSRPLIDLAGNEFPFVRPSTSQPNKP